MDKTRDRALIGFSSANEVVSNVLVLEEWAITKLESGGVRYQLMVFTGTKINPC